MSEHLFLFAISPVQAYIEQARKTQDLYAGSYILSHLCKKAIEATGLTGDRIIFPRIDQHTPNYSLPNRLIALVEKPEPEPELELKKFGETVEKAVRHEFEGIATSVITAIKDVQVNYRDQIKTYLSINWLFVPLNGDYRQCYKDLERLGGGIKKVRAFEQLPETGRKCSVCGERNVKFYRKTERAETNDILKKKKLFTPDVHIVGYQQHFPIRQKFLQPGEGLCAVCFAKRMAETYAFGSAYEPDFPSTSEIALLDALNHKEVDKTTWSGQKYDGNLIFDQFNKKDLSKQRELFVEDTMQKEWKTAQTIYNELVKHQITPVPYYAVLRFDGDSMGKWLAGEKIGEQHDLQAFHIKLSQELARFAQRIHEYFKMGSSKGCCVYAGGDDFLGFVSLQALFAVLEDLRREFDQIDVSAFTKEKPTFSAGVVIAHYKTPLSEALKWSQRMEHEAKELDKEWKDAFAIAVLKHSGEIHKTVFKWREDEWWTTKIFQDLMAQVGEGKNFSSTFITGLDREFRRLMDADGQFLLINMIEPEIQRLLKRACQLERKEHESQEEFQEKKRQAIVAMTKNIMALHKRSGPFENFLSALRMIDFLTRKVTV